MTKGICLCLLIAASVSCIEVVPISQEGNLTCVYGDRVVFTGSVTLTGNGIDRFQDTLLSGTWGLCNVTTGLLCSVTPQASAADQVNESTANNSTNSKHNTNKQR